MHRTPAAAEIGTLYVVATPLGNLRDITLRALDILGSVDWVAAEDTRVTRRLLQHYGLAPRMLSVHEHNERAASAKVLVLLGEGASVALVSDAGTPAVSDPGAHLVALARERGFAVVPVPGPSALTAALSVAGLQPTPVLFQGFLPVRPKAARELLSQLSALPSAIVLYEAPHRIAATLSLLCETLGPERSLLVARELTKVFENVVHLKLGEAGAWLAADANRQRGEFVLVIDPPADVARNASAAESERVLGVLLAELPLRQAVTLAAEITGDARKALYARALELKGEG
jgi:16S rRNA (cytidine1402-2'-O)-methyltransferase